MKNGRFEVGDIITGTCPTYYGLTNNHTIMKVRMANPCSIKVEVIGWDEGYFDSEEINRFERRQDIVWDVANSTECFRLLIGGHTNE